MRGIALVQSEGISGRIHRLLKAGGRSALGIPVRRDSLLKLAGVSWMLALVIPLFWKPAPVRAAEACLTCHGPGSGLTNSHGKSITVRADGLQASVHRDLSCVDCHAGAAKFPHTAKTAGASCVACHSDASEKLDRGAHAGLGRPQSSQACVVCHGNHGVVRPSARGTEFCHSCHTSEVEQFSKSIHGRARGGGNGDAPSCTDCHGAAHQVISSAASGSPVSKTNLPETCGRCHSNPALAAKYLFTVAKPVEAYKASVHGRAVRAGKANAPACNDCHGVHDILPASDPRSSIAKPRVAATCAKCHEKIYLTYRESVHGRAVAAGERSAPTCTDCHGEHDILAPSDPSSPVYVANVSRATCSRCHEDQRLVARLDLPRGRMASYENSFHGMAAKAGSRTVANCASCHGVHNILPSSDPRSTIAKANLPETCGKCHPDAGKKFALGPVHVVPASAEGNRLLYYVRLFYLFTIPTVIGFMLLHNLLDWGRKVRRQLAKYRSLETELRLTLSERIQHVLLLVSFTALVITGFALKFPESFWAAPLVRWERDFPLRGLLHRVAAVVLIAAAVYHVIYLLFTGAGRRSLRAMLPKYRDVKDAVQTVGYNLGYRPGLPVYAKFNYAEKVEYWALVWGTVVMVATGIVLWAHNLMLEYFPKWVMDVATAIHYYEAILATLAIFVWHFYAVIFDPDVYPLKWTFVTGRAPEHAVREETAELVATAGSDPKENDGETPAAASEPREAPPAAPAVPGTPQGPKGAA